MKQPLLLAAIAFLAIAPRQASAQCPPGESEVIVNLTTDQYGTETTWEITGISGSPVYADGGPYNDLSGPGTNEQDPVVTCIPDGVLLVFTIYDAYGDGINSTAYGLGSYSVTLNGEEVAEGGAFGVSESTLFQTGVPQERDLAMLGLSVPAQLAIGEQSISGTLRNFGTSAITSFDLNYSIDGGSTVTAPMTVTIQPGEEYNFVHPTTWTADYGTYEFTAWASNLNGDVDMVSSNDSLSGSTDVIGSQAVQRVVLMEQFTSSTCPPCAALNVGYAPFLQSLNTNHTGSHVAAVKYHMNWPSPGNDPSYNPDGNTRKSYYGVTGIPDLFLNGSGMTGYSTALFETEAAKPAFVNIDLSYDVNYYTVDVTATVDCYTDEFSGSHKLHIVAVEDSYSYPASTTNQDEFHYVQRKMFPNGQGTVLDALSDGSTQTVEGSYTFGSGAPAQGNFNLWTNLDEVTLVAFVQNVSTKKVLQATFVPMEVALGLDDEMLERGFAVFPNPTANILNVKFELPSSGTVQMVVTNVLGEQVLVSNKGFGSGAQRTTLDLSGLDQGMYYLTLISGDKRSTRAVSVTK
ncbi:MAG TPA: T9SS type A sorting domain-containing protein [Flavobacteriales bacterium]